MDDLLKPVSTKKIQVIEGTNDQDAIQEMPKAEETQPKSSSDILETLHEKPTVSQVAQCLNFLVSPHSDRQNVKLPSPTTSQIINVLATKTLVDFWELLDRDTSSHEIKANLLSIFRSVSGLGGILGRLKSLIKERRQNKSTVGVSYQLRILLRVLALTLEPLSCSETVWNDILSEPGHNEGRRALLWKEYVSSVGSGLLSSMVAQAEAAVKEDKEAFDATWLSNGPSFADWLGGNVVSMTKGPTSSEASTWTAISQLSSKCLSFGYIENFVGSLLDGLALEDYKSVPQLRRVILSLRTHEQRKLIQNIVVICTHRYLRDEVGIGDRKSLLETPPTVGGVIALLLQIAAVEERVLQHLEDFVTDFQSSSGVLSPMTRRAIVATLVNQDERIQSVLDKAWERFGNQLFIRHAPIPQQEAIAQILLLAAGYVHRSQPMYVFTLARSSTHTHGISNRIASTSPRARLLGMYVGAAISELVDKPDNRLKFEGEDMKTTEASWYLTLTKVKDIAGSISGLKPATKGRSATTTAIRPVNKQPAKLNGKQTMLKHKAPARQTISKAQTSIPSSLRIVELNDDKLEADLTPYAKPDSDPEDDSPDPTLVNLNRSTAPIYIRDLLSTIADTENIDRATLALRTAPSLIRRKANFGTEVSDHIEELATTIANLHDAEHFDFDGGGEEFARMRQKALQAVLVADPKRMGTWFARAITGVGGDYSISQRIALLAAMGLGGREIAGFKDEDDEDQQMANAFPSKKLKGKMHDIWAGSPSTSSANLGSSGPTKPLLLSKGDSSAVNSVAQRVSRTMLEPMALSAADTLTGPDVLKVRKFSSRMDVEARRKKPVSNELSKIITEAFFFPLMGMFGAGVQTLPSNTGSFSAHILPVYLQTVTILLHSSGSSTPTLPTLTSEYWDLLLSLRSTATASNNVAALEAILFGFLTLLELNADKQERIAKEHGKELVETQEWARMVLENAPGGDEQADRVKMLAAGVVVKCSEVVDRWRRLLLGDMIDL